MKIRNKNYKSMLEGNFMLEVDINTISRALDNIKGGNSTEHKVFLIVFYYTGARPAELLRMKKEDVTKEKGRMLFKIIGLKGGMYRTITLPGTRPYLNDVWNYTSHLPDVLLFRSLIGHSKKIINGKEYIDTTYRLRHYFKKWFDNVIDGGIPPYYLRHNCFSKLMMAGATAEEVRQYKGARTLTSVMPYLHLSRKSAEKTGNKVR